MPGKRIYRYDEEPESDSINDSEWFRACRFCGGEDHEVADCLQRPLSDWVKTK